MRIGFISGVLGVLCTALSAHAQESDSVRNVALPEVVVAETYQQLQNKKTALTPFLLSPIGKMLRFSSDWGESIDVKHRTEKVIHVKLKKYDGFIDYDGNIVFYFAEDEF